jgi:hypothetical protein
MKEVKDAIYAVRKNLDRPLATIIATEHPEDRYFIGEALLTATVLFLLNRYAGAYVDRLGLKPLAESHADKTKSFLQLIRAKTVTPADILAQERLLEEALTAIRKFGVLPENEAEAIQMLTNELIVFGAIRGQASDTAVQVAKAVDPFIKKAV